jgi:hypothetical protein
MSLFCRLRGPEIRGFEPAVFSERLCFSSGTGRTRDTAIDAKVAAQSGGLHVFPTVRVVLGSAFPYQVALRQRSR